MQAETPLARSTDGRAVEPDLYDGFAGGHGDTEPACDGLPGVSFGEPGAHHLLADRTASLVEEVQDQAGLLVGFAAAADIGNLHERKSCGHVIDGLMGGSPEQYPERYRLGSPVETVPVHVPQRLVNGGRDPFWTSIANRYVKAARAAGADLRVIDAPESGHFEMIDPSSTTWPLVRDAARELLEDSP